jgi:hypothetical protein
VRKATVIAGIHKHQWLLILLAVLVPLLLNAVGMWQIIGPDVLTQTLKGAFKVYGIPYNPWPRILGPTLVATVLLGLLAWLAVFTSTRAFLQRRSMIVKFILIVMLALFTAKSFGIGTFLIDVSWSSAFRFNATFGLPASRFADRDVRLAFWTIAVIMFYTLQLSRQGNTQYPKTILQVD